MKNIIFFDDNDIRKNLLPLTYTRPVALLRVGITTIAQKWISLLDEPNYSFLTATYLKPLYRLTSSTLNLMIAGHMIPTTALARQVAELQQGEAILAKGNLVAFYGRARDFDNQNFKRVVEAVETPLEIASLPDIFRFNEEALALDFEHITKGRESQPLSASNTVIGPRELIFLEPGAEVEGAFLNTTKGPIYIGKDAEVMEGSCIRAPFAACHDSKVRMGAKVYGATTLGPFCKIGGEVENTIMLGYSNKAHEGFLGDAVIGHWCNIGGGTTASNLKNDYSEVKLWNYPQERFLRTGLQFCGPIMGDHCKTGVNCMINTGTVLGVGVNLYGSGFPRNFVPSFMEGSSTAGFKDVSLNAFFSIAERVVARRGVKLSAAHRKMYTAIYEIAKRYKQ